MILYNKLITIALYFIELYSYKKKIFLSIFVCLLAVF